MFLKNILIASAAMIIGVAPQISYASKPVEKKEEQRNNRPEGKSSFSLSKILAALNMRRMYDPMGILNYSLTYGDMNRTFMNAVGPEINQSGTRGFNTSFTGGESQKSTFENILDKLSENQDHEPGQNEAMRAERHVQDFAVGLTANYNRGAFNALKEIVEDHDQREHEKDMRAQDHIRALITQKQEYHKRYVLDQNKIFTQKVQKTPQILNRRGAVFTYQSVECTAYCFGTGPGSWNPDVTRINQQGVSTQGRFMKGDPRGDLNFEHWPYLEKVALSTCEQGYPVAITFGPGLYCLKSVSISGMCPKTLDLSSLEVLEYFAASFVPTLKTLTFGGYNGRLQSVRLTNAQGLEDKLDLSMLTGLEVLELQDVGARRLMSSQRIRQAYDHVGFFDFYPDRRNISGRIKTAMVGLFNKNNSFSSYILKKPYQLARASDGVLCETVSPFLNAHGLKVVILGDQRLTRLKISDNFCIPSEPPLSFAIQYGKKFEEKNKNNIQDEYKKEFNVINYIAAHNASVRALEEECEKNFK